MKWVKVIKKVQSSSYNIIHGHVTFSMVTIVKNAAYIYLKVVKKANLGVPIVAQQKRI